MILHRVTLAALACLLGAGLWIPIDAATLPTGFIETQVANGLSGATAMEFAPDGRLFVALEGGQVRVIKNGALLPTPFVSVNVDSEGERGLLGITFDPNFATNNFIYVYYTAPNAPVHNRLSRFTANGDVAVANSEVVILEFDDLDPFQVIHNGGAIHFGKDGKLYIAIGDNAHGDRSQLLDNRLGKILRVNADGTPPSDNPFFNQTAGDNRSIWAMGLRNPFTFAVQPGTGRIFINDVGQVSWEEINDGIAGANYGWPGAEGPRPDLPYTNPVFSYAHDGSVDTTGCAITGGAFYNPATNQFPSSYVGKYFFADFCIGWIRVLDTSDYTAASFAAGLALPVDLKVSADGSLYYLQRGAGGAVFKIQYSPVPASVTGEPASQTVPQGQPVTFQVTAGGSTPLEFQWQRNMVDIPGANASSYNMTAARLADDGAKFRCVVANAFGTAPSDEATLTVQPTAPILDAQENTDIAIALDSVTLVRDPFSLDDQYNFSTDNRTRIALFVSNLELLPGETSSSVTAQAEDSLHNIYPLTVEFVGTVPGYDWLAEVVVRLPDSLPAGQDIWISMTLHTKTSNKVRFKTK